MEEQWNDAHVSINHCSSKCQLLKVVLPNFIAIRREVACHVATQCHDENERVANPDGTPHVRFVGNGLIEAFGEWETALNDAVGHIICCLLYTSDAADEEDSVDLGGRRIIKKKKKKENVEKVKLHKIKIKT
eukprot:TRINITY_DN4974_c0_g1_i2.p3 TRINITY_DN4974_c0_g1~~TRINITY_DN4974_c0_g1_i2.p3  ORF type:complete len:132 (-),score=16.51 TRINITY_DN4974_c0_g1_i2:71-466(-)